MYLKPISLLAAVAFSVSAAYPISQTSSLREREINEPRLLPFPQRSNADELRTRLDNEEIYEVAARADTSTQPTLIKTCINCVDQLAAFLIVNQKWGKNSALKAKYTHAAISQDPNNGTLQVTYSNEAGDSILKTYDPPALPIIPMGKQGTPKKKRKW